MRKLIAAINMTLDGYSDHTAITPDAEIHQHYADLLRHAGTILYGRTTYQLMEFWRTLVESPSGEQSMDDFAKVMDSIPKVVFSHSLQAVDWQTARLAKQGLEEEAVALKQQSGKDILVGSRSLILQLMKRNLIDEYQICVHPVVVGSGLPLFEKGMGRTNFKLVKTKVFGSGAIILYYEPTHKLNRMSEPKIALVKTQEADLHLLFQFQLDKEGAHLAAFTPANPSDKEAYIKKYTAFLHDPTINMQTIKINDEIVGSISKFIMEGDAEITYWIDRKYWGQGIATTALKTFLELEQTRPIFGRVAFDNYGSQKVLEKCGFIKIGTDKGFANARQAEIEEYIYKLAD